MPKTQFTHSKEVIGIGSSSLNLMKFEYPPSRHFDFKTIWRDSRLRKLYRKHFKKYAFVQSLLNLYWRNISPVFYKHIKILILRLTNNREVRWRPLIKLSQFIEKNDLKNYILEDRIFVDIPDPLVFPNTDRNCFLSSNNQYIFPKIYATSITNGKIYGGSNFAFVKGEVVCHDLYDFEKDYTSEELHGKAVINPKLKKIRWLAIDESPKEVPIAASFVDACAHNYAHWMSEVFPRVALFCSDERFRNIPIVVNDGLHKNIMESLSLVAGHERAVILIPDGKALCCKQLFVISASGYVPFDWRKKKIPNPSHGVFNGKALNNLLSHFNSFESVYRDINLPDKIFIPRNTGTRKCRNIYEIEKQLSGRGYTTVLPEKMSFIEQVKIFNNAKVIIAPTGAGLANAIFCKPGTYLGILMARHERMIYRYWTNMLAFRHLKIFYVLGDITKNKELGIHGDFSVNQNDFMRFLEAIEGNHA